MAPLAVDRKRKQSIKEHSDASDGEHFPNEGGLDLLSEDEEDGGHEQASDSDEIDAFPEIDAGSDTEEEEGEEESPGEDGDNSETDGEQDGELEDASSDDDLHIFPKAKTIISDITGQPKKVYPEIEPDYDSDSSTEDVRAILMSVCFDRPTD
jgi:ribosome biogenesis protein ERB1